MVRGKCQHQKFLYPLICFFVGSFLIFHWVILFIFEAQPYEFERKFENLYFSFVAFHTIGFGDFSPQNYTGKFTINAQNSSNNGLTVDVSGAGTAAPSGTMSITPSVLDFGSQIVNTTSAVKTFKITNIGTANLNIIGITANNAVFAINNPSTNTLAPNASVDVQVFFSPTAAQNYTGKFNPSYYIEQRMAKENIEMTGALH